MNRLLIESFEGRLLLGVTSFVVIMILVGWIAINEPARMASFELQHTGRSVERGAELFAMYCSTCHNADGRGIGGRAPALNSPHLFGFNFVADINNQILRLERNVLELTSANDEKPGLIPQLEEQRNAVFAQIGDATITEERKQELVQQLADIDVQLAVTPEAQAALDALLAERTALTEELAAVETTDERKAEINGRLQDIDTHLLPFDLGLRTFTDENEALTDEKTALSTELDAAETTDERKVEIESRLAAIESRLATIATETPKLLPDTHRLLVMKYEARLAPLYPIRDAQLQAVFAPMVNDYLPRFDQMAASATDDIDKRFAFTDYLNQDSDRLAQIGWASSVEDYVRTTLIHGRPGSNSVWAGNAMVAFAQTGGGNLRPDQIDDLVNYVVNFDKGDAWSLDDLYAVNQFAKLHGGTGAPAVDTVESVYGADVAAATAGIAELTADPARGDALYNGLARTGTRTGLGCKSCHQGGIQAPDTAGTFNRVTSERLLLPEFAGISAEQYLVQSIMSPNAFVVTSYNSGVMPTTLSSQLTPQDLADIVAYLKTQ